MPKISTLLRQWCGSCAAATVTRRCIYPPDLCCSVCCPFRHPSCADDDDDAFWEADDDV
jgi:hypothetical protein